MLRDRGGFRYWLYLGVVTVVYHTGSSEDERWLAKDRHEEGGTADQSQRPDRWQYGECEAITHPSLAPLRSSSFMIISSAVSSSSTSLPVPEM